jgi:hypothetical protein
MFLEIIFQQMYLLESVNICLDRIRIKLFIKFVYLIFQTEALKILPKEDLYWIKMDGTDIKPALQESVRGDWNGDVDLGDGKLQELREEYEKRKNLLNVPKASDSSQWLSNISLLRKMFDDDATFLLRRYEEACKIYAEKKNPSTEKMKEMSWDCVEFSHLLQTAQRLSQQLTECHELILGNNLPASSFHFKHMANDMKKYLTDLFKKKRSCATHIAIRMVSSERRNVKPYAIPVQYVPYHSLTDQSAGQMVEDLRREMQALGLNVVGKLIYTIIFKL